MRKIRAKYYIRKGIIRERGGDLPAAIDNIQHGLKLNPDQPEQIFACLGNLYLSVKNYDMAQSTFQRLIEKYPDSVLGYSGLAMVAQKQKDWETALKFWDICLAKNTGDVTPWWLVKRAFALLETGRYNEARELFLYIRDTQPDEEWGYYGLAHVTRKLSGARGELQLLEEQIEKFPNQHKIKMRYGLLLREFGRYDEAEACFQHLKDRWPNDKDVLSALFWTARASRQYDLAVKRSEELIQKFPGNDEIIILHLHALIDTLEYDRALLIFDQHLSDKSGPDYLIMKAAIYWEQLEEDKALREIDILGTKYPKNLSIALKKAGFLGNLFRSSGDRAYLNQALQVLDGFGGEESIDEHILEKIIEISILLNQKEDALKMIARIPAFQSQKGMELKAWACHIEGDEDGAKEIWQSMQGHYYLPHVQFPNPDELKCTATNPIQISQESILVFTVVRNERWRLPWFLEYYRSLGVDRFFFVDNDSSDGTAEFLQEQEDVYVFWTDQNYAKSYSGMQWVNWLVEEYGSDCWCLYVDVDEALIFPGMEKRSLKALASYMAKKGTEAMYAFMLDMYEPGFQSKTKNEDYKGFLEDYPMFDSQYLWINSIYCPYRYTEGGVRVRLQIHENQTKTPIIRGGRGIKFLMSSHRVSPAVLTDVTGVLLHFKLAGDFENAFANDLVVNTRMPQCKRRHWGYLQSLHKLAPENCNNSENAVSYRSSQQLLDLGLIKTSADFETGKYD